jgi:hypothetical protein
MDNPPLSPLALDLTGAGLELIARENSGAVFDLNGDSFATWTAWLGSGSGFLAHDVNGNGRIDDISELFGAAAFNGPDDHGFTMLAMHDHNGDGVIDANDAVFSELLIWRDFNGDGISDDGELLSLAATGIVSISLAAAFVDDWRGANWISHTATYTLIDGTVREIHDVWFDNDPMHSHYAHGQDVVLHADVAGLPDLAGYGFVNDLRYAMSEDEGLRTMMRDLVLDAPALGAVDLRARFETFLQKWAGVDGSTPPRGGSTSMRASSASSRRCTPGSSRTGSAGRMSGPRPAQR